MKELAPIILFVYNRPWHTLQTLEALKNNDLADESKLIIYCDGPKQDASANELEKINEVKKIIHQKNWCKHITVYESDKNKGLARSIIEGITENINIYGKVIVLEDDIVTSTGFLKYMNEALDFYENTENVMHISGYMFPVKRKLPKLFFFKPTSCWGWGTWSRAWKYFEKNATKQIEAITRQNGWNEFTIDNTAPSFKNHLYLNQTGKINTWAIFWYASVFLNHGTSLHPYPSLTQNIGFDGSGIHCGETTIAKNPYFWNKLANKIESIEFLEVNEISKMRGIKTIKEFYTNLNENKTKYTLRDKFYVFRKKIMKFNFKFNR